MAKTAVSVDEMLTHVGEIGRFQIVQHLFLSLIQVVHYFLFYISYFATLDSPWRCNTNSTVCTLNGTFSSGDSHYKDRCTMPRKEWQFIQADEYSLVTHFELYCDSKWIAQMPISILYLGWFLGGLVIGGLADRFGRRKIFYICNFGQLIGNFLCAFSPNVWFVVCIRFILGLSIPGAGLQGFILITEMIGSRYRTIASSIYWQFVTLSNSILALTAYYVRDWKLLFIMCSAPYVFILGFFPFLTESVRWLQASGQNEKALETLRKVARFNGKTIPDNLTLQKTDDCVKNTKPSLTTLFKTRKSTAQILTLCFAWICVNMLYYGLSLSSANFGGNLYLNFFLISLMEIPAAIVYAFTATVFGRKGTAIYPWLLASAACFSLIFIPHANGWGVLRVVIGMIGKFLISISYSAMYQWGAELYPTSIRATATSFMQASAPLGGSTAPWIVNHLQDLHLSAPFAIMGCMALLSAVSLLRLPETKDKSIDEVEENEESLVGMLSKDEDSIDLEKKMMKDN